MARHILVQLCFMLTGVTAEECLITTRTEAEEVVIIRDCPTTIGIITCNSAWLNCREVTFTKTVTSTTSVSSTSTSTGTTRTTTSSTASHTTSTSSTLSQTSTTATTSYTRTAPQVNLTNVTTIRIESTTPTTAKPTPTSTFDAAAMVVVEGVLSFASEGVSSTSAVLAAISSLSWALGLSTSQIRASAALSAERRLSDHWRVSFQLYVLPEREPELRQELAGLKNSVRFAQRLREDLTSRGSQPIEDLTVSLDIVPVDEEKPPSEDDVSLIIIVAAVVAVLVMAGAVLWKLCGSLNRDKDELLHKEEGQAPPLFQGGAPRMEPAPVGNPARADDERSASCYSAALEPPLPAPEEHPESVWSDAPSNTVRLADVQPEVGYKRPSVALSQPDSVFLDHQLNDVTCRALSPSTWTGRLIWAERPREQVPLTKDYQLTFQRGGRLGGHCYAASSQSKITGRYHRNGELLWREVPQGPAALAMECQGRLRICQTPGARNDCFEIVGIFTVVSTTISARQLGSGRLALSATASIQPTAFGNEYHVDEV